MKVRVKSEEEIWKLVDRSDTFHRFTWSKRQMCGGVFDVTTVDKEGGYYILFNNGERIFPMEWVRLLDEKKN